MPEEQPKKVMTTAAELEAYFAEHADEYAAYRERWATPAKPIPPDVPRRRKRRKDALTPEERRERKTARQARWYASHREAWNAYRRERRAARR